MSMSRFPYEYIAECQDAMHGLPGNIVALGALIRHPEFRFWRMADAEARLGNGDPGWLHVLYKRKCGLDVNELIKLFIEEFEI